MKKFGIIKNEITEAAKKAGWSESPFTNCNGRAQLLAKIASDFTDFYREGTVTLEWLREYYNEEELNRQRIYTTGNVSITDKDRNIYLLGDCKCFANEARVYAFGNSIVDASGNCRVYGYDNAKICAMGRSVATARDHCVVTAEDYAHVNVHGQASVHAMDRNNIVVYGECVVVLQGDCTAIVLNDKAKVCASSFAVVKHRKDMDVELHDCAVSINTERKVIKYTSDLSKHLQLNPPEQIVTLDRTHLIPAPFDEKNLCTDWISDDLFFDGYISNGKSFCGLYQGKLYKGYTNGNRLYLDSVDNSEDSKLAVKDWILMHFNESEETTLCAEVSFYYNMVYIDFYDKESE